MENVLVKNGDAPKTSLLSGPYATPTPLFGSFFGTTDSRRAGLLYIGVAGGGGLIEVEELTLAMPGLSEKHQIRRVSGEMVVYQRSLVREGLGVEESNLDWCGGRGGGGGIGAMLGDRFEEAMVHPPGRMQLATSIRSDDGDVIRACLVVVVAPSRPPVHSFGNVTGCCRINLYSTVPGDGGSV